MSRFFFVQFKPIPEGSDRALVERRKKSLIALLEARDRLWDRGKGCPNRLRSKIDEYEKWLSDRGFMQMEDMPPELNKVITDNFWELF
jgi:hypothetical protein